MRSLRRLERVEDRLGLLAAELAQCRDGRQVLGTRARLAVFPLVDRLARRAEQQAAVVRRQAQALAMRGQALGAEAKALHALALIVGLDFGRHRLAVAPAFAFAEAAQLLLERL